MWGGGRSPRYKFVGKSETLLVNFNLVLVETIFLCSFSTANLGRPAEKTQVVASCTRFLAFDLTITFPLSVSLVPRVGGGKLISCRAAVNLGCPRKQAYPEKKFIKQNK